jgi:hypothetical protein
MPGKSRHGRGKHSSRKSKTMMRQGTAPPQSQASAAAPESPRPAVTAVPAPRAAAAGKANVVTYPFIASELRRIAVLAGIVIVILVVLSIFLS